MFGFFKTYHMTTEQFEKCQTCLNRKKGTFEDQNICNIRGHYLKEDEICSYYEKDKFQGNDAAAKKQFLKPNFQRANNALIIIAFICFLDVVAGISSYLQLNLLQDIQEGMFVAESVLEDNDNREFWVAIIYTIASISGAVIFIQWFRRAYFNMHVRFGNGQHSEGWAAGSWFVPIISLYRPYQIMKEMDEKATQKIRTLTNNTIHENTMFIGLWWFLWIVSNYLGKYILKKAFRGETIEDLINLTTVEMVNSGVGIVLGFFVIKVILDYRNKESQLVVLEEKENKLRL